MDVEQVCAVSDVVDALCSEAAGMRGSIGKPSMIESTPVALVDTNSDKSQVTCVNAVPNADARSTDVAVASDNGHHTIGQVVC